MSDAQQNDARHGAQRFTEYCAGCHGVDGRGGAKAPSLLPGSDRKTLSENELFAVVHDGTKGGMPAFAQIGDDNIVALVRYLRLLRGEGRSQAASSDAHPPGDAQHGSMLFFGKAQCSHCHMVNGKGGFIGKSLTDFGRDRSAASISDAILHPDTALDRWSHVATVTTKSGQKLSGVLRNEDNFTVALQTEDGRYHLLSRDEVTAVQSTDHSLMPRDYALRLTPAERNDIVSYLMVVSRPSAKATEQVR